MTKNMVDWSEIIGKTISKVDTTFGENVVGLTFTDGSEFVVDTEAVVINCLGAIYTPCLFRRSAYGS